MKIHLPTAHPLRSTLLLVVALLLIGNGALAKADRGYLGVTLQDINRSMAKALQLDEDTGVLVLDVVEEGPAEKAGLEAGDVILAFAGEAITEDHDLTSAVRGTDPGETVKIEIQRDGKRRTIEVELGKARSHRLSSGWTSDDGDHQVFVFPDGDEDNVWFGKGTGMGNMRFGLVEQQAYLGVELGDLNEQLGEYFGVADGEGALVNSVRDDTPAAAAGLRAGDVIVAIGDEDVEDSSEARNALIDHESGDEVEITYIRKGDRRTAKVTLAEMPEDSFGYRVGRLPRLNRHLAPNVDIAFPEGFERDIHVVVPEGSRSLRRVIRADGGEDLDQLRKELKQMKDELKDLQKELQEELKK